MLHVLLYFSSKFDTGKRSMISRFTFLPIHLLTAAIFNVALPQRMNPIAEKACNITYTQQQCGAISRSQLQDILKSLSPIVYAIGIYIYIYVRVPQQDYPVNTLTA